MKISLKHAINSQLDSVTLDSQQLDKLIQLQKQAGEPEQQVSNRQLVSYIKWSMVASIGAAIVVTGVTFYTHQTVKNQQSVEEYSHAKFFNHDMVQKIADEVAGNHLKKEPMQVASRQISQVQGYFSKLGFLPIDSQQVASNSEFGLSGGRYCSIQGSKAAQLRYMNEDGNYITLFETPYSEELFKQLPHLENGDKPIVTYAKGLRVTIWIENDLLMVKTEEP